MPTNKTIRVCVPVCEKSVTAFRSKCQQAIEWADIVELRLDCLAADPRNIFDALRDISRPVILTYRPSEQGGHRNLSLEARASFWKTMATRGDAVWWDLEEDVTRNVSPDWSHTIISHHDFSSVPPDLAQIYERLAQTPARVVKIAVQAKDIVDCIPVFQLLDRARKEGKEIIAIAMGNAGIATRILGPSRGAFLTYGPLDDDGATAPGQVNASKLRSLYNIDKITNETMICGLAGFPVMHSVSPHIHNAAFAAKGLNAVYLPFEVSDVNGFFKRMVHPLTRELDWNLRGLSITAPHKQTVMDCIDWIEPDAKEIGAVNTVVIEKDRLLGYNTDADGLIDPLTRRFGSMADKKVAIIGAGGAARAAIWVMRRERAKVTLFARNVAKAQRLAEIFDVSCQSLLSASFAGYDLVINATPVGSGEQIEQSPATTEQLNGALCVYDLIYNPSETRLLHDARKAGCETLGGLAMLIAQARLQFELWTGEKFSSEFSV